MKLNTSFADIFRISLPIMIGSAGQNVITLTDSVFVGRLGEVELGAIGIIGVFYLIVAGIGYSFSRGAQIMIARRAGQGDYPAVGRATYSMFYFELALATIMFLFMHYGMGFFLSLFVNSPKVYHACMEYIHYRSYGVFFSYLGVSFVALYTGIGRTWFIMVDTIIMAVINAFLAYVLVFGKFGFPNMGIGGAGLASTIAEGIAFIVFIIYVIFDKYTRAHHIFYIPSAASHTAKTHWWHSFHLPKVDIPLIRTQLTLSLPIVAQMIVSLGSSFVFFSLVENLGERPLAITNLMRIVYLICSIPAWGYASGINTLVSNVIGQNKPELVVPITTKTAILSVLHTVLVLLPIYFLPQWALAIGTDDPTIVHEALPTVKIVCLLVLLLSFCTIIFNGLVGTGATNLTFWIQTAGVALYTIYVYIIVEVIHGSLQLAWTSEIVYWLFILVLSYWYLLRNQWKHIKM